MRNSYFLVIPKQHSNPPRLKEFEEKFLLQWVSELPVANPSLSTRLLYDLITEMNSLMMPVQLRLDSLELLGSALSITVDFLRAKLLKGGFPKDTNEQKSLVLLVEVERQFAIGYWISAKALTGSHIGWFKGKQAALSIQRCLRGLGAIVAYYYMMGMTVPDWIWLDLHSLYKLSVKVGANDTQVPCESYGGGDGTCSPEGRYLQTLLLCLANPPGLMGREIEQVEKLAHKLCKSVKLKDSPIAGQSEQCLIITDEDKAPFFQNQAQAKGLDNKTSSAVSYIDFSGLFQYLEKKKLAPNQTLTRFSARSGEASGSIAPELLFYLQQRWSGVAFESAELFSDRLDRLIAVGLLNTHHLSSSKDTAKHKLEFVAHSVSGKLLSVVFGGPNALSVGSLISLRKVDDLQNSRLLAVVGEIFSDRGKNKLNFGVHLLATKCIPAEYTSRDSDGNGRSGSALLIKQAKGTKARIVMDNSVFREGDILGLTVNENEFNVMLNNKTNVALGYWQFECIRLLDKEKSSE